MKGVDDTDGEVDDVSVNQRGVAESLPIEKDCRKDVNQGEPYHPSGFRMG